MSLIKRNSYYPTIRKVFGVFFLILIFILYIYLLLFSGFHVGSTPQAVSHEIEKVPDDYVINPIAPDSIWQQEFLAYYTYLDRISLVIVDIPNNRNGALYFSLLDSNGKILKENTVYLKDINAGEFYDITFNSPVIKGEFYTLQIELVNIRSRGPQIICAAPTELLSETGSLSINGNLSENSVVSSFYYIDNEFSFQKLADNIISFAFILLLDLFLLIAPVYISITFLFKKKAEE